MTAKLVEHDVPACYQEQLILSLEVETAGVSQRSITGERTDPCSGQQERLDHWVSAAFCGGRITAAGIDRAPPDTVDCSPSRCQKN